MEKLIDNLVVWLRDYVRNSGGKGLVFGLSGGIDSAVVAALSKKAFPDNSLGIIMPIDSIEQDEEDARLVAQALSLDIEKVDLTPTFNSFIDSTFNSENKMAISNIKPRLRMSTLYYFAQDRGYLVCGSSNKSEFYLGYYTKHGDSGVDLLPLVNILKTEIYEMAKLLGIPEKIINKKPSAGLWEGQTDEDEMGFTYEELDAYIKGEEVSSNIAEKISKMNEYSEHKRVFPPMFIGQYEK